MLALCEPLRFVTATSLFDGHDASINIVRRLLQERGAEVIHLGHNRSVPEIVDAAICEDADAIAVSSYQGGHIEFFKYMVDLLKEKDSSHIKVFGGGGGVIVPDEIRELQSYGVRIYSPKDGLDMGLSGMIDDMISQVEREKESDINLELLKEKDRKTCARLITFAERNALGICKKFNFIRERLEKPLKKIPVIGITGTGGSGKSSLLDEIVKRFLIYYPKKTFAIIAVDPSKRKSGGALLGDRIRMNSIDEKRVYMRSMATRMFKGELSPAIKDAIAILKAASYDIIFVETAGIGQGDTSIVEISDISIYVMTQDYGGPSQLEKIDMLDFADIVAMNKFDHKRSKDALRDVIDAYRRSHKLHFDDPPVFGTVAKRYNDPGCDALFSYLTKLLFEKGFLDEHKSAKGAKELFSKDIIPKERANYLGDIVSAIRAYHKETEHQFQILKRVTSLKRARDEMCDKTVLKEMENRIAELEKEIKPETKRLLENFKTEREKYKKDSYTYTVREDEIKVELKKETMSGLFISKVALPSYEDEAELYRWLRKENLPGKFPYTAGVFPLKRVWEEPKRQFAGEGTPERTNRRFHYLCADDDVKRLSVAFDSLTLYGHDPDIRPDIFGKIGEGGVNVCTLDDMKRLFLGFDLCSPKTSVSMTINGPAPIILAMFFNTAIDQKVYEFKKRFGRDPNRNEYEEIRRYVFSNIRGTVQSDILKEDQAQNSCIFPCDFSLKMMGDVQEFFIENNVRNFYSVSISGYHIAEAGANPITQLAFTLANGFTYLEYYRSRGMDINQFARNLSFFFSTGMDPEYSVIGRVARRIWAIATKDLYGGDERSQKLKYHIQTSGRSLQAKDINFNDIRTTLQALLAISDNCNSLHTNSYDEAITTPTEESVRRAVAIQLIIAKEFGLTMCENPLQGSFFIEWLTDAVEEAVLEEFLRINERGGVLEAMESYYQRKKIQDESLAYERAKESGRLKVVGVNLFKNPKEKEMETQTLQRATLEEKKLQLKRLKEFQKRNEKEAKVALKRLKDVVLSGKNIFCELLETTKVASLGQITEALFEVGGKYRRNI